MICRTLVLTALVALMALVAPTQAAYAQGAVPLPAAKAAPPASAAASKTLPRRLIAKTPEYPRTAALYNVTGPVDIELTINRKGKVTHVEPLGSPADILTQSVLKTAKTWKFEPPAETVKAVYRIPFNNDLRRYEYDTAKRALLLAPRDQRSDKKKLRQGSGAFRLLIDRNGKVNSRLILWMSSPKFEASIDRVISRLRFDSAPFGKWGLKGTAVNAFRLDVAEDGSVQFEHYDGL